MAAVQVQQPLVDFLTNPDKFFRVYSSKLHLPVGANAVFGYWQILMNIFAVVDFILLVIVIGVFIAAVKYRPNLRPESVGAKKIYTLRDAVFKERWTNVAKKIAVGTPDAFKVAIIDADKLVDDVLKQLGFEGDHMADRLEKISPQDLQSLERLWRAHRLRNNLVHTPGFQISGSEAKKALTDYELFLREVKVLE